MNTLYAPYLRQTCDIVLGIRQEADFVSPTTRITL